MIRFRNVALAAGIIAVLSAGSAVNAGVIYDNLSVGMSAVDYAAMDGPLYNSFSAGASQSELTDVKMLLGGNPNSSASFTVNLLSDSAKSPGSVLTTLGTVSDGSLTSGAQSVRLHPRCALYPRRGYAVLDRAQRPHLERGVELRIEQRRNGYRRGVLGVQPQWGPHGLAELEC